MKRLTSFWVFMVAVWVVGVAAGDELRAKPRFRSFCYDDWLCEFMVNPSPLQPEHLDMLVNEAKLGGADVFVMNPAGMTTSHPSKVWQTMWKAYAEGDRDAAFGTIPKADVADFEAMLQELKRFADSKIDYLAYTFAACRRRGIATGVSIRMNDVHGTTMGRNCLVSDFWIDHPELRIPGKDFSNYDRAEVREYFMKLIAEMIDDYDIDVLDLDFWRNPLLFSGRWPGRGAWRDDDCLRPRSSRTDSELEEEHRAAGEDPVVGVGRAAPGL